MSERPTHPFRGVRRAAVGLLVGLIAAVASLIVPGGLASQAATGADLTCVLALEKSDPGTVNVAFPDESATYWGVEIPAIPGTRVRISGQYPHARYMSFNAYDPALRPFAALADVDIRPDRGSSNPFAPRAHRKVAERRYTVFVEHTASPSKPAPNTIYTDAGRDKATNAVGYGIIYRIYVPDEKTGEMGGVALPTVTLEQDGSGKPVSASVCDKASRPGSELLNEIIADSSGVPALDSVQPWGLPSVPFRKFVNLPTAFVDFLTTNPYLGTLRGPLDPVAALGGSGGFLSNVHNSYVAGITNLKYGKVLKVTFKAPETPRTRQGQTRMPKQTQVRYWSFCQEEFFTQRFVACKADDQVVRSKNGNVTFVISRAADRPQDAVRSCGVNWLSWGPNPEGIVLIRNMLARQDFNQSVQKATYGDEPSTMKSYYPRARYFATPGDFDAASVGRC
ncbi:hypothetical protein [Aeromicrobium sp.]|uniref:hypothetical protein n=1 Tax=Aeromicrobium sp. TaxID=1871063 RepID=UPI003C674BEB